MSDVSQGPGWWIASDGRWYPPHLHPSAVQVATRPPTDEVAGAQPTGTGQLWSQPQTGATPWPSPSSLPNYPPGYGPPPGSGPPPGMGVTALAYPSDPAARTDEVLRLALAPWWKRVLAFLIDGMILAVAGFLVLAVIAAAAKSTSNSSSTSNRSLTPGEAAIGFSVLFLLLMIPFVLYFGIMNGSKRGQTLGKMALSVVVRDARSGGPIGFWRGVGRYAITVGFFVLLVVPYLIDNLAPLWDARRQAWHDKVVRSVVVDRNA